MAYDAKNLSVSNPGCVYTGGGEDKVAHRAHLITADAAATVETAAYFDAAYLRLPKGTIIDAVMAVGGTPVRKSYVVTASSASGVTIALQTATAG